jgi:hypothetical protein
MGEILMRFGDETAIHSDLLLVSAPGSNLRLTSSCTACFPHNNAPLTIAPAASSQSRTEHGGRMGLLTDPTELSRGSSAASLDRTQELECLLDLALRFTEWFQRLIIINPRGHVHAAFRQR